MSAKYVRNLRPNLVKIRVGPRNQQIEIVLDRRGSRTDTAAVPAESYQDRAFQLNFAKKVIEEITQDQFMALATRIEDEPQQRIAARPVKLTMDPENPTHMIPDPQFQSPKLEFVNPTTTEEDVARLLRSAEREAAPIDLGREINTSNTVESGEFRDVTKLVKEEKVRVPKKKAISGVEGGHVTLNELGE